MIGEIKNAIKYDLFGYYLTIFIQKNALHTVQTLEKVNESERIARGTRDASITLKRKKNTK